MTDLVSYLRAASARPFVWGEHDCLLWLGEWVAAQRGSNPAQSFCGRYRTRLGAMRIVKRHGGMVELLDRTLLPLGFRRTEECEPGDIAVVAAPEGEMGAIVTGSFMALRGVNSIFYRRLPVLAAWKI